MNIALKTIWPLPLLFLACQASPTDTETAEVELEVPTTYAFTSRFEDQSSVSYSGQTLRHVLIVAMKDHVGGLTERIDNGSFAPVAGDVVRELQFYYEFDSDTSGAQPHGVEMAMPTRQSTFDDISTGKDLKEKLAGNDPEGQHVDWSQGLSGWAGAPSPDGLVQQWFVEIENLAVARAQGDVALDPGGTPVENVFVSADGRDYQQLLQKFLTGAVTFSQAADDYLDDDLEGKGLNSDNVELDEHGATALEHAWDEAFGYFGAARDYADYTDEEIAAEGGRPEYAGGFHDYSGDAMLDLESEFNFGHAVNAGKRDLGAAESGAPTDFSEGAIQAFLTGRTIITSADGELSAEQLADLQEQRDILIQNWEAAIASTVIHYINDTLGDMDTFGTEEYSFADHAKHWSELKGFALSLQFNPRSALNDTDFARLHTLIGDAPVLPGADGVEAYRAALLEARALVGSVYGFAPQNVEGW